MKNNTEKLLDLVVQVEKLNQEYRAISEKISGHATDCWSEKLSTEVFPLVEAIQPCLTDWLEKKIEIDYQNCPVTGREYEIKVPYWVAPRKTEEDCPHCYAALKLIEKRKELRKKRGRIKAQITKIAKSEILKLEGAA